MTLCMHVANKDALIVCSDGRTESFIRKDDGSDEIININYDTVKSFVYNDVIISFAGTSISFENRIHRFVDFFDNLYDVSPDKFNIRELPSYLVYMLWGSDRYEFLDDGCEFLISGFSPKGKPHVYLVKGKLGEIINLSRFQDFGCIGITSLANSILSDLITSELQTESILKILELIVKTYCDYSKLRFDEMFDSKSYSYHTSVGGKWIFYVLDFKTKKGKYVKFCSDGKIRYYLKLVQNEFK